MLRTAPGEWAWDSNPARCAVQVLSSCFDRTVDLSSAEVGAGKARGLRGDIMAVGKRERWRKTRSQVCERPRAAGQACGKEQKVGQSHRRQSMKLMSAWELE